MKRPSATGRVVRYFWRQWRDELTPAGKCLVWGISATGLGTVSIQMPIYQLFCGLVTFLAAAASVGWFFRPQLSIAGSFPEQARAGVPLTAMFTVRNVRRVPAYDVGLTLFGLPEEFDIETDRHLVPRIGPGETATLPVQFLPRRRGRYSLPDLRGYSTFPFYIGRSGRRGHPVPPLLVLPAYEPLAGFQLSPGSRYQPGGLALSSRVGESPEYLGNREYQPGEPVRRLDFRAWARTGRPVVREFQEEFYSRIALIVDTYIPSDRRPEPNGFEELEAAISLTASVAEALSNGEYVIDVFASGPELHMFQSGRGMGHFENVLRILAGVDACRHDPFPQLSGAMVDEFKRVSTVICVLTRWSDSREQLCRKAVEAGCLLKVLLVQADGEPPAAVAEFPGLVLLRPADIARGGLMIR